MQLALKMQLMALPVLLFAIDGLAQCPSPARTLSVGCYGIGHSGCCTTMQAVTAGGSVIKVDAVQFCSKGADNKDYLCLIACPPSDPSNRYCGWMAGYNMYDCNSAPTSPPGGQRQQCYIPCDDISDEGCCEGDNLLKYCKNGSLQLLNCASNTDPSLNKCGWDPVYMKYTCYSSTSDSVYSSHPRACHASVCTPDCANKSCGNDGCGGQCGTCVQGLVCSNGRCVSQCTPDCTNKSCGDDGCGGQCGTCVQGLVCSNGRCVSQCAPDCTNKSCGDDGCGGSCGSCQNGAICVENGQCIVPGADAISIRDTNSPKDTNSSNSGPGVCPAGYIYHYGRCIKQDNGKSGGGCKTGALPANGFWLLFVPGLLFLLRYKKD